MHLTTVLANYWQLQTYQHVMLFATSVGIVSMDAHWFRLENTGEIPVFCLIFSYLVVFKTWEKDDCYPSRTEGIITSYGASKCFRYF